jgi:protein involved in polysaccharide export with SLBB domain
MEAGKGGPIWRPPRRPWLGLLFGLLAGCATTPTLDRALRAPNDPAAERRAAEGYTVACPDALDLSVPGRPDLTGREVVGPDGCIALGGLGRLRVEGHGTAEIGQNVAAVAGVPPAAVRVRVADFQSQQLYLVGQVAGLQRAVPYQGPETVLDLLRRVGGLTAGAAPEDVYVVRSRLAEGKQPEVFRVNLRAIVLRHDPQTNISLQPFDQVFVGESGQSCLCRCVPPWLRPLYEALCGMRRAPDTALASVGP